MMLPVTKLATNNASVNSAKVIVTDGAPDSVAFDLQTTFTWCPTVDESHICNHSRSAHGSRNTIATLPKSFAS